MPAKQVDAPVGDVEKQPAARPSRERFGRPELAGWLVATVPGLAELLVGGYRIAAPSLWRDEAATIVGSQRPVGAILALVRNADAVHGPYYLLMHFVIAVGGRSETALRLPSLIAMCLAVSLTAVLARRLAQAAALPAPSATGLAAGLLLTAVPLTTRYAQEARPYALTSLFAVLATYLLVRAASSRRRAWWGGYALALALTGLFNLFAVLLAVAHGVSLVVARRARLATSDNSAGPVAAAGPAPRAVPAVPAASAAPVTPAAPVALSPAGPGAVTAEGTVSGAAAHGGTAAAESGSPGAVYQVAEGSLARWLAACAGAAAVLAPMAILALGQSAQLSWVTTPDLSTLATLVRDFAGASLLIPLIGLLAGLGCAAGPGVRRGHGLTVAVVTLPWLVLPPVLLLAVSGVHPVYSERYVVFCLPALSVLSAAGLTWLVQLVRTALWAGRFSGGRSAPAVAVAPSVVLALVVVGGLFGPQRAVRLATARADNLRTVAATVAANERPGDAIVYLPWDTRTVGMAYPAPFLRLRDVELGTSPVTSATLRGLEAPASVVAVRLRGVGRVWTVRWAQQLSPGGWTPTDVVAATAVRGMRLIRRWHIASVVLSLYSAR